MSTSLYFRTVHALGDGRFRLIWFANVIRGANTVNFNAVFSPCVTNPETGEEFCNTQTRHSVSLPVAYLRQFRIGDIWENGQRTSRTNCETQESFALDISKENITIAPIGLPQSTDKGGHDYLLPFSTFDAHRDHTKSQCARIPLADGAILVIPCMELIRFYFGASGAFLKQLFSGALGIDSIFSNARLNPTTRVANIQLAPNLPGVAATTVARIAFSSQAMSAARWIVNSGIAASVNQSSYYPKTSFPFHGQTNLTARGCWIQTGTSRVFLAEQLLRCTHPFPFASLYYTAPRSISKAPAKATHSPAEETAPPSDTHDQASAPTNLSNAATSYTMQAMGMQVDDSGLSCFPDLEQKKIRRVGHTPPQATSSSAAAPAELGAGDHRGDSSVREAEFTIDLNETPLNGVPPPEAAELLEQAVKINQAIKSDYMAWKPIVRNTNASSPPVEPFLRGDTIFTESHEQRLHDIWVGRIEVGIDSIRQPILLLIRDNIPEDADDHIVYLRLEQNDSVDTIRNYCEKFAASAEDRQYVSRIVGSIESQRASDTMAILRNLSMVMPNALRQR